MKPFLIKRVFERLRRFHFSRNLLGAMALLCKGCYISRVIVYLDKRFSIIRSN